MKTELWQRAVLQGSADLELFCRERDLNLNSLGLYGHDDGAQKPGFWQGMAPAQQIAETGEIKLLLGSFGWQSRFCWTSFD